MKRDSLDRRFQTLHAIGRDINSSLDLDKVLATVMDKLIELTDAERGFILLDSGQVPSSEMQFQVARNFSHQSISEHDVKISRSVVTQVMESRQPVLTMSAIDDPRFQTSGSIVAFNLRSILCVPMQVRGGLVGVIYLDNTVKTGTFNADDQQFLETFADIAGIAIDNASLFGELNNRLRELSVLKRYVEGIFDGGSLQTRSNDGIFEQMAPLGEELTLESGDFLWHEGDQGDYVALVADGMLDVIHETPNEEPTILRRLQTGAVLGEMACLQSQPRSASIRAATRCTLRHISADQFRDVIRRRPDVLEDLFWQQVDRVRTLTDQVNTEHHSSITDTLTHLYNFGFFRDRLRAEVDRARKTGDFVSIIVFDIDNFKEYNDNNSHHLGNICLAGIADLVRQAGRRTDVVARYGGEEFITLLYGANREVALRFAEKVRQHVRERGFVNADRQPLGYLSLSAGVAMYPADANTDAQLLEAANANLVAAKAQGRDRVVSNPHWRDQAKS